MLVLKLGYTYFDLISCNIQICGEQYSQRTAVTVKRTKRPILHHSHAQCISCWRSAAVLHLTGIPCDVLYMSLIAALASLLIYCVCVLCVFATSQ